MHRFALSIAIAMLVIGCESSAGRLGGSLSQIYRLNFSETRVRLYDTHVSVEYVAPGEVVPVRISLDRRLYTLGEGTFDLTTGGEIAGRLRSGVEIPRFTTGKLTFTNYGEGAGSTVQGDFDATFDVDARSFGLEGQFGAALEIVELPVAAPATAGPQPTPSRDAGVAGDAAVQGDALP